MLAMQKINGEIVGQHLRNKVTFFLNACNVSI